MHPLGLAPVIVDGDITIAESGAIVGRLVRYLVRNADTARPQSTYSGSTANNEKHSQIRRKLLISTVRSPFPSLLVWKRLKC